MKRPPNCYVHHCKYHKYSVKKEGQHKRFSFSKMSQTFTVYKLPVAFEHQIIGRLIRLVFEGQIWSIGIYVVLYPPKSKEENLFLLLSTTEKSWLFVGTNNGSERGIICSGVNAVY